MPDALFAFVAWLRASGRYAQGTTGSDACCKAWAKVKLENRTPRAEAKADESALEAMKYTNESSDISPDKGCKFGTMKAYK